MAPKFGLRMNWKKQQQHSNLSDTDPSNIGTSLNWQSSKDILNIYNWVWLWVWLGHAVVFLMDLSHLWVKATACFVPLKGYFFCWAT